MKLSRSNFLHKLLACLGITALPQLVPGSVATSEAATHELGAFVSYKLLSEETLLYGKIPTRLLVRYERGKELWILRSDVQLVGDPLAFNLHEQLHNGLWYLSFQMKYFDKPSSGAYEGHYGPDQLLFWS